MKSFLCTTILFAVSEVLWAEECPPSVDSSMDEAKIVEKCDASEDECIPELVSTPQDRSTVAEAWAAGVAKLRDLPLQGSAVRRHRAAALNPHVIETTRPADRIRLSLFPDLSYIVQNTRIDKTSAENTLWVGQVADQEFSSVRLLVTPEGELDGALITREGHFRILPIDEGPYHLIYEVDYEVLNAAE